MSGLLETVRALQIVPPKGYLPGQERARALLEDPSGPECVLLSGGQGAGKSMWLGWEALRIHFINLQWCLAHGRRAEDVWTILLAPTHGLMRKGLMMAVDEALAETNIGHAWNRSEGVLRFDIGGGMYAFTAEHPERIVAVNASAGFVDEPGTPKSIEPIRRVFGRLRGPGLLRKVGMAGTPEDITSRSEFYDFIASPAAQQEFGENGTNTRRIVFASTRENRFIPRLEQYVSAQTSVLTKQQALAYVEGQFVAFNIGRVYSGFIDRPVDAGGHRIPPGHAHLQRPAKGNELFISLDFNVNPMCGIFAVRHTLETGETGIRVLDEIRLPAASRDEGETPIGAWCREAIARWVADWNGSVHVFGDATAERGNVAASKTGWALVHDALRPIVQAKGLDYHVRVWGENPREIDRVNSVNAAFERGAIIVAESCAWLRRDLNLVSWKEGTTQIDKSDGTITHLSDALGYLWVQLSGVVSNRSVGKLPSIRTVAVPSIGEMYDWPGG